MSDIDIHEVLRYLPHRYPFLLVDRVIESGPESLTAIKNVTINEPFFIGHFPKRPVMPGVLIVEALAQASLIHAYQVLKMEPDPNTLYYFVGIDKARFKRPVEPGDQLLLKTSLKRRMKGIWMFSSEALVGTEVCATAEIMCASRQIP